MVSSTSLTGYQPTAPLSLNIGNFFFFFFGPCSHLDCFGTNCVPEGEKGAACGFEEKSCVRRIECERTVGSMSNVHYSKRKNGSNNSEASSERIRNHCNQRYINKQALKSYFPSFSLDLQSALPPKLSYQTYSAHLC